MKKLSVILFALAALLLCGFSVSAAKTDKTNVKVIDHVVYKYCSSYNNEWPAYYAVTDFFDTAEAAKNNTKTTIKIQESIDGIPVTLIQTGYFDIDCMEVRSTHRTSNAVRKIILPDSITHISDSAFSDFGRLKTVRFPNGVTEIPDYAFCNCTSLKKVEMNALTKIGNGAFENCRSLSSFRFPDTLQQLGERAFAGTRLKKVSLPCIRYSDACDAFQDCQWLEKVTFRDAAETGDDTALVVATGMFQDCDYLKAVVFPKKTSAIWIDNAAFHDCDNLTRVKNTAKIVSIDSAAFGYCWQLKKFVVPAGIQYVHPYAFLASVNLKTVFLNSTDPTLLQRSLEQFRYFALQDGNFLYFLRNDCMVYVKTPEMKKMVQEEGLHSKTAVRVSVAAPQTVTAERADGKLTLQWTAVKDADGYGVFRFDAAANGYVPVDAAVEGERCVIADAPSDAQYIVRACRVIDGDVSWSADSPAAAA